MTPRSIFSLLPVVVALACGSSQKPPPVEEVPINGSGTRGGGTDNGGGGGGGGTTGGGGGTTSGGGGGGGTTGTGTGPTPLTTDDRPDAGAGPAASAAPTGPTHPGGLTSKESHTVINKFLTMMSTENHIPLPDLNGQSGQLGDALSGMKGECAAKSTKKQYTCAMASRNTAAWKKCME